jgi:teichoic acid transport system ATP-binding protein
VGDKDFQQKSFARMATFREIGTTLIIVSHNLGQIEKLCSRVLWLEHGRVREDGLPEDVLAHYMQESAHSLVDKTQVDLG